MVGVEARLSSRVSRAVIVMVYFVDVATILGLVIIAGSFAS